MKKDNNKLYEELIEKIPSPVKARFMFAVTYFDDHGQSIELFKKRNEAEKFLREFNKFNQNEKIHLRH